MRNIGLIRLLVCSFFITAARAEPAQDPGPFMGQLTAIAEECALRDSAHSDMSTLLLARMTPDDRKLYDERRETAGFEAARIKFHSDLNSGKIVLPPEICQNMYIGLKK